ncbi:Glucooligosaccharide oxidase [Hebeloma cylindrosporum]|uniref:Glucooligosaccharide oxidase n=1 Tax=Hebeloma cylindrosporum TaxID=76867 RepID=A0A0C2XH36_HEBCY|nr:Glucooligosaccharide oxidase [Hebeloma cylindrosporum h7]
MGINTSTLSPQSQPGSALQTCLTSAFADAPIDYTAQIHAYNLDYPVYPAAIVRPKTTEQVSAAVQCAVKAGVKVQPRSGGHSFANYCLGGTDGALVVDLINLQKFEMDRTTWKATVGGGTLLGDITKRMHNEGGRAIAHGTCPQVGIGGHATIGGLGPISRQWGSSLDHIREVEVVLANGTITRANDSFQPDLYFAIRGAAASFGIVTEFVFQTNPEPPATVQYSYTFVAGDYKTQAKAFSQWQSIIAQPNLDRKLASMLTVTPVGLIISGTYFGTRAEFNLLNLGGQLGPGALAKVNVFNDWLSSTLNWAEQEAINLLGGIPAAFYSKSLAFRPDTLIPDSGLQSLFKFIHDANKGTLAWVVIFDLEGGAVNDVPLNASAYAHRDTLFYLQSYAIGLGKISQTTRNFLDGINNVIKQAMPGIDFGAYAGYVDAHLPNGQQDYWGANYPRLQQIKAQLDPQEVFWNPQSVRLPGNAN